MAWQLLPLALCVATAGSAEARGACAGHGQARDGCGAQGAEPRELVLLQQASVRATSVQLARAPAISSPSAGSVLYLVKAYSGYYGTRLHALMQTWGSLLKESSLLVVGDRESPDMPVHTAPGCASDSTHGLTCRVGYGLTLAARHPGNWSWVFLVDDDHYVRTARLEEALAELDARKPVAAGCYGCGRPQYCNGRGGFCGGCGYALSRPAVAALVGRSVETFLKLHSDMSHSKLSDGREDMATSCALIQRVPNLQIASLEGLVAEPPDVSRLREEASSEKALLWHHVPPDQMLEIHRALSRVRSP